MSLLLKLTRPVSSRLIFEPDARITYPASSRVICLASRRRRSWAPSRMRRAVGLPPHGEAVMLRTPGMPSGRGVIMCAFPGAPGDIIVPLTGLFAPARDTGAETSRGQGRPGAVAEPGEWA